MDTEEDDGVLSGDEVDDEDELLGGLGTDGLDSEDEESEE